MQTKNNEHALLQEHDQLMTQIGAVQQWWPEPARAPSTHEVRQLHGRLQTLRDAILRHFQGEERGGYFQDIAVNAPRLVRNIDALLRQHAQLLKLLDDLLKAIPAEPTQPIDWNAEHQKLSQFVKTLQSHEQGEVELLQNAYEQDAGNLD